MTDRSSSWERRPSLDLYYQRNFKNQQSLILNVVGTYMDSNSKRHYKEMQDTETLTDLFSNVDGNKYSIIGEGIYEKTFKAGRLSTGIKHTQSFTDNEYTGSSVSKTDMRQADTYMNDGAGRSNNRPTFTSVTRSLSGLVTLFEVSDSEKVPILSSFTELPFFNSLINVLANSSSTSFTSPDVAVHLPDIIVLSWSMVISSLR